MSQAQTLTRRAVLGGAAGTVFAGANVLSSSEEAVPPQLRTVSPSPALEAVRDYVVEKVSRGIVPSVVVQVTERGRAVWAEAFGHAELETQRKATLGSIYKIASISKPFTVSALLTLVDRGGVEFDAPANRYLTGARLRAHAGSADEMTLRRLANHTAGLPIHEMLFYDGVPPLPPDETLRRYGFAAWQPGSRFKYSNLGTAILGFVGACVAGTSWREFLRASVLGPLGLMRTFVELPPGREREFAGAHAADLTAQYDYDLAGGFVRTGAHLTSHPGASAMWSTVGDLTRFARMHLADGELDGVRILSSQSVRTMQQFTVPSGEAGVAYGNGWISHANLVHRNFNHSGGGPGMGAMLAAYPDDDVVTVVLTNYSGAMAPEVTRRIAESLFGAAGAVATQLSAAPPAAAPAIIGQWQGVLEHHRGDIPVTIGISDGNVAEIAFGRIPPTPLESVRVQGGEFSAVFQGTLVRQPGFHGESILEFDLRLEGGQLIGIADTYAKGYFEVAHWVRLKRV